MDYGVPAAPARHVIVHFHMFKNAGTTIEAILEREFRGRFATLHGTHANSALDSWDIEAFLEAHPHISAISSHHLRHPLPSMHHAVLFDSCFLRHPLDRLQSIYSFLRSQPASADPIQTLARSAGPREFAARLIEEAPHFTGNPQTLLIAAGGMFTRPLDETDLARAVETIRCMALPGLVHMFDESLLAAEYFLGPAFPGLRLHYAPKNVRRPERNLTHRLEELQTLWGANLYEELLRLNRLDLELCHYAVGEMERRLSLVPNRRERLLDFEARCSTLRSQLGEPAFASA